VAACVQRNPGEERLKKLLLVSIASVLFAWTAPSSELAIFLLNPDMWGSGRVPAGWQIKVNHGKPDFSPLKESAGIVLRLRSDRASFGLERGVDVDVEATPYLNWRWKVTALPTRGDFRRSATDDQAAQILVAFADRRVVTYLWDSSAPQGTMQSASSIPLVHIFAIVCRSGPGELNQWLSESRNVAQDYQRAYGRPAPHVKGLRLQINSQHTGTVAESYFGQVAFQRTPQ
jgi:hypothetical protein